jgi:hypothetical protein
MLWVEIDYAIYRTKQGIYIQFSDDEQEASEQRQRFAKICPELCELRYLTPQIRDFHFSFLRSRASCDGSSLYDHNIAQAMMLAMEGDVETGKSIAQKALNMAVERVANDNTIRYVRASLLWWVLTLVVGALGVWRVDPSLEGPGSYLIAGMAGALPGRCCRLQLVWAPSG